MGIYSPSFSSFVEPYKFSAYRNATLTLATAAIGNLVTFDTIIFDTGSNYSTGTGRFTAPVQGYYWFGGQVSMQAPTVTSNLVSIYKNGTEVYRSHVFNAYSGTQTNDLTIPAVLVTMAVNDYVQVYSQPQNANTTVNGGASPIQTFFSGYLVSPA